MKRYAQRLLPLLAVVITFVGAVFSTAYPLTLPTAHGAAVYESDELREYAYQVAAIVNRERQANGLPMLRYSDTLSEAANTRAREIQTYFSHTRPNGTSCFTAVTEMGIRYRYVGENIAYGQRSPEEVMNGWMNSSGHRANILSPNFEYMGIGVAKRNGVYYWTQFFAAADGLTGDIITFDDKPQTTETQTALPETTASMTTATAVTETATVTTTRNDTQTCIISTAKLEALRALLKRYGIDLDALLR